MAKWTDSSEILLPLVLDHRLNDSWAWHILWLVTVTVRLGGLRGYSRQCDRRAIRNRAIVLIAIATSQFVMKLTTRDLGCQCAATYTNRSQGGALAVTVT